MVDILGPLRPTAPAAATPPAEHLREEIFGTPAGTVIAAVARDRGLSVLVVHCTLLRVRQHIVRAGACGGGERRLGRDG